MAGGPTTFHFGDLRPRITELGRPVEKLQMANGDDDDGRYALSNK